MRIIKIIVFTLLIILLLVAGFFLGPAHYQINRIEPIIPTEIQLRELQKTINKPISIRFINTATQNTPTGQIAHSAFVIEWQDGNTFVVDLSMDDVGANKFGAKLENLIGADKIILHGDLPSQLGEKINKIKGIAFTHQHLDHTQGLNVFCENHLGNATIYQSVDQNRILNMHTEEGNSIIQQSCLDKSVLKGEGLLTLEDFPGIAMIPVGGHTPGSTLYVIAIDDHLWVLSGDISNTKSDLINNKGKGFLYSYLFIPENTNRLEELRLWLSALDKNNDIQVVVSHDLNELKKDGMLEYKIKPVLN